MAAGHGAGKMLKLWAVTPNITLGNLLVPFVLQMFPYKWRDLQTVILEASPPDASHLKNLGSGEQWSQTAS